MFMLDDSMYVPFVVVIASLSKAKITSKITTDMCYTLNATMVSWTGYRHRKYNLDNAIPLIVCLGWTLLDRERVSAQNSYVLTARCIDCLGF